MTGDKTKIGKFLSVVEGTGKDGNPSWSVINSYSDVLGEISWYRGWRKYTFEPRTGSAYDSVCLYSIADFLRHLSTDGSGA